MKNSIPHFDIILRNISGLNLFSGSRNWRVYTALGLEFLCNSLAVYVHSPVPTFDE